MYVCDRIEHALRELEELYETEAVLGTLVVAGDDAEANVIASVLRQRDHSVAALEPDLSAAAAEAGALRAFADGEARALVMSYPEWARLRREIERHAMGHSVLVVGGMEDAARRYVCEWARDAHRRGLAPASLARGEASYHVLTYAEAEASPVAGEADDASSAADDGGAWREF